MTTNDDLYYNIISNNNVSISFYYVLEYLDYRNQYKKN
jgi:hypothetical protein